MPNLLSQLAPFLNQLAQSSESARQNPQSTRPSGSSQDFQSTNLLQLSGKLHQSPTPALSTGSHYAKMVEHSDRRTNGVLDWHKRGRGRREICCLLRRKPVLWNVKHLSVRSSLSFQIVNTFELPERRCKESRSTFMFLWQ